LHTLDTAAIQLSGFKVLFFKPQNVQQGISNIELKTSSFCGSLFDLPAVPLDKVEIIPQR